MFRSPGLRFIAVGVLALLMFIPLNLVSGIVEDRAGYSRGTIESVSRDWGGPQLFSGPLVVIPVTEEVTYDRRREAVDAVSALTLRDDKGNPVFEQFKETVTETRAPVYLYPDRLDIAVDVTTTRRHRGIFEVPVYTAAMQMQFHYDAAPVAATLGEKEEIHWQDAALRVFLGSNHALRGEAELDTGGRPLPLEPIAGAENGQSGIVARVGDPRALGALTLKLTVNGAQSIAVGATGRTTRLTIRSDWTDPGFTGTFLPDSSDISQAGFTADWTVPHLARSLPQAGRSDPEPVARSAATMGVRFATPNDFYQKAWRASRYGILFITLTFLTILLLDRTSVRPAYPVQYLMVGLAQSVFTLLMVAYAEQIGFGAAYLLAATATVLLITLFAASALRFGRRTWGLGGLLGLVYGILYLILKSEDYALLAGSTLAFAALAVTMWLTRNEDWHGPERTGSWWRKKQQAPPEPA